MTMLAAGRVRYCAFCDAVLNLRDSTAVDAEFDKADRIQLLRRAYRRRHRRW